LLHHPQSSKNGPHWNDSGDGQRRRCQKTSPRDRWSHANCATEPRVTKVSPPLGHDTGTLRERERLGDGADNTRDATLGWLKSGTGVPGPSRRGLRRRKPSSDTQAPPPLGECQKLSVSPVSDHQRQAMSVMPAVRQDSDEESRPEKPLLMDASRKWSSLQPPMWAAGRTITSTEKPTGAKTNRCDKNVGPGETKQQRFPNQ